MRDGIANKCCVVCTSHEIVASMLLETNEFLSVKDDQLIDPTLALPPVSEHISRAISVCMTLSRLILKIHAKEYQQLLFTLFEEHLCPNSARWH
ncbi:uncharacterized protein PHALS_10098 [Plasmopara halstedii]|uniref:Uncharacterized protein n=1 Tax=Plasmopara halstedii TaxID=4781 RepID=A0A0N7L4X2_PLAHL|nr:uncharacterized protein PHALS_10098 [Plasmopara halstedii]CEG39867.1 hypothetical protein PHALS_10098 [Plasmopara halstedii]|eukprot:XP_024576236.1 hypothetical protein PHALS_10098 [Plasmopara halstedii]